MSTPPSDDPSRPRRVVASLVLALAITAGEIILAGLLWPHDAPLPEAVVSSTVVLEKAAPTPRPIARPTPVPTSAPVPVIRATLAPVERAAPRAEDHAGGVSAAAPRALRPVVHHAITLPKAAGASGVARAPGSGDGAGSGSGTGDDTGSGAGNGGGGTGTGAITADAPCGYVEFRPDDKPRIVGNVSYETVRATVHYPDGHTNSDDFPYPWVYTDYMETDPWSPMNVRRTDLVAFAQLPPPGADTGRYSGLIRYILDHTNPNGSTVLQPCPH